MLYMLMCHDNVYGILGHGVITHWQFIGVKLILQAQLKGVGSRSRNKDITIMCYDKNTLRESRYIVLILLIYDQNLKALLMYRHHNYLFINQT